MKTSALLIALTFTIVRVLNAADTSATTPDPPGQRDLLPPTPTFIDPATSRQPPATTLVDVGPHHRLWSISSGLTNEHGNSLPPQILKELGTGLNYFDSTAGTNGAWA